MGGDGKTHGKSLTQHLALLPNFKSLLQSRGTLEPFSEKVTRSASRGTKKQLLLPLPLALDARRWLSLFGWIFPSKKSEAAIQHGINHLRMFGKALVD